MRAYLASFQRDLDRRRHMETDIQKTTGASGDDDQSTRLESEPTAPAITTLATGAAAPPAPDAGSPGLSFPPGSAYID